jgi:hypothetical protein
MLNYIVAPEVLRPLAPAGTELDSWGGATYVSVVGFRFLSSRVMGIAVPWHVNFEEVNLRFYVRRRAEEGWRRGVVFIRELVPRRAITWVARALYNEPYAALPMRHHIVRDSHGTPEHVRYEWRSQKEWEGIFLWTSGRDAELQAGSQEEFITEHYWGYTRQRDGSTVEYRVEHPRWRVWQARDAELRCDPASLYGAVFAPFLSVRPASAFLADGSSVAVHRPVTIDAMSLT